MKTLGIFGDSFASLNPSKPSSLSTAWPNQLDPSQWLVTNYAMPATSFYWTYRLFLDHHASYDRVVCVVTRPGRITMRNSPYVLGIPFGTSGYQNAEWLLEQTKHHLTPYQRVQVTAMRDYLMHVQDYEYEVDANSQLLEHLKRERPDAIFIPISNALPNLRAPEHTPMMAFTQLIINSLAPSKLKEFFNDGFSDGWIPRDELEPIQCHMTPEVNAIMAQCVEQALASGVWAPNLPDRVEHSLGWDDYYAPDSMFSKFFKKSK
jgi:hypothetical protein